MSSKLSPKLSLVVVESPSKCKKIEEYLGPGFRCVASCGHVRELISLDNIDIEGGFQPTFTNIPTKQKQINMLRKEIREAGEVIIATDDDREGEAIGWHICQLFGLNIQRTKRIVFHEITREAIQHAITIPTRINMNIIHAQHARQIMDLLVGYKITPTLWTNPTTKHKKALSAGRCQSPALRLIYDNYKNIAQSQMKEMYNVVGYFTSLCIPFHLEECEKKKDDIMDLLKKSIHFSHMMTCESPIKTIKYPPQPFTTSLLQQRASSELHFSPAETMKICQTLYESGYITYMRTDSTKYSNEFICKARKYILDTYKLDVAIDAAIEVVPPLQPHEAIRPTNISLFELNKEEGSKERKMYRFIWKNAVMSCMPPAIYSSLKTIITSPDSPDGEYSYTCEVPEFLGWKTVDYKPTKEEKHYHYLLNLKKVDPIPYKKICVVSTMSNKIGHYCEARLVQQLEHRGIGRPSTFASLVDKIQDRGYVSKMNIKGANVLCVDYELEQDGTITETALEKVFGGETGKLVLEPIGLHVVEFLEKNFIDLFDYNYTKKLEDELDQVCQGTKAWNELCKECNFQIDELIRQYNNGAPVVQLVQIEEKVEEDTNEKLEKDEEDTNEKEEKEEKERKNKKNERHLGRYLEQDILLKKGKFGLYFAWKNSNISLKTNRRMENITMDDIISLISREKSDASIIRKVSDSISIRQGKQGKSDYLFFKTEKMKKPSFLSIEGYDGDYKTDNVSAIKSWLREKYGIY